MIHCNGVKGWLPDICLFQIILISQVHISISFILTVDKSTLRKGLLNKLNPVLS